MKIQLDRRDATVIFLTLLLVLVPLTLAGGYLYSKHQWATDKIAEVTPPVGFNLFVLQNMTGQDSNRIARAAIPFFLCLVVCIGLITVFPQIVTVVPDLVMGPAR